ncbi:MAG: hypothetical protein LBJ43_07180 [Propionibacteriaceae bacterium]|nr:hypothetical protein [Propionibacteriaceae bacterium]
MIIEHLYPEVANLYGDPYNVEILRLSRPDALVIETQLAEAPAFAVRDDIDLVYLGSMTEAAQQQAADALEPYRERIALLVRLGKHFLFTGNALDLVGERVVNHDMGYEFAGLGFFQFVTTLRMFSRVHNRMFTTVNGLPMVGYRSTFSYHALRGEQRSVDWGFGHIVQGQGLAAGCDEGVRLHNLIATEIIGPLLITNPLFTKQLLAVIGGGDAPLAHEEALLAAYQARLAEFRDPRRWGGH